MSKLGMPFFPVNSMHALQLPPSRGKSLAELVKISVVAMSRNTRGKHQDVPAKPCAFWCGSFPGAGLGQVAEVFRPR
jgi:hypothetical protein